MSRVLTISLGAIVGFGLGAVAMSLIRKVDSESRPQSGLVLTFSCMFGLVVAELISLRFSQPELRACFAFLCSGLLVQSLVDAYTHRLVRQISHLMALSGVSLLGLSAAINSNFQSLVVAGVCTILGVAISFTSNKVSRGSLGAGDARLMAVLGWHLGFIGYSTAIWALFAACMFASVFAAAMAVFGRVSWQQRIAFGPFLALGTMTAIFAREVPF